MKETTQPRRFGEIMINSDWITAVGMAVLFAFVAFLLIWSIRDLWFDKLDHHGHVHLFSLIIAAYFFFLAYSLSSKSLRIALLLVGTELTVRVVLGYLSASASVQHSVEVAGAFARQIAYTIFLFEIARWFRSVIGRPVAPNSEISDS